MKKEKLLPHITERYLQVMAEVIAAGGCKNKAAFAKSVGDYPQNLTAMQKGERAPTVEQLARTCAEYGYSANWLLLGTGLKKTLARDNPTIEQRLTQLELQVHQLKRLISKK